MTKREALMKKIATYQFAAHDLQLFLDTHSGDTATMEQMQRYEAMAAPLIKEYESQYGALTKRSEELQKAYGRTKGSDRMKTTFLHYMTNQMTVPSDLIERSVTKLSNNYDTITPAEAEYEVGVIKKQSEIILDLLDHMVEALEIEKEEERKEVAHE